MVRSQPSGVLRRNEMRDNCCFSSGLWQPAHAFTTVASVTGMPTSALAGVAGAPGVATGACAAGVAVSASAINHEPESATTRRRAVFAMIFKKRPHGVRAKQHCTSEAEPLLDARRS